MTADEQEASTTFVWKRVRVRASAAGTGQPRRSRAGWRRLPTADRTREVTIRIVHRGGAESWWLVKCRGETGVFSGVTALEDVMRAVLSER